MHRRPTTLIYSVCCVLALAVLLGVCSPALSSPKSATVAANVPDQRAFAAVRAYVDKSRGWASSEYSVELNSSKGRVLVFWIVHKEDNQGDNRLIIGGGGKSFAVDLDETTHRVIRERHFQ